MSVYLTGGPVGGVGTLSSEFSTPDPAVHVGARPRRTNAARVQRGRLRQRVRALLLHIRVVRGIDTLLWIDNSRIGAIQISTPGRGAIRASRQPARSAA
jgi:hypothetical protein